MTPADPLIRSWVTRHRLSEHARLEVAHAVHAGHQTGDTPPLAEGDPVPGCSCAQCIVFGRGGSIAAAEVAEGIIRQLALVEPADRLGAARRMHERVAHDLDLPGAGWLCRQASELPGALEPIPEPSDTDGEELPVEEARRVSILDLVKRLGLGEPKQRGREYVVRCPLHNDHDPSLRLNPRKGPGGVWKCWPCAKGGDGIDLVQAVREYEFSVAVRWIAGSAWEG